MLQVDSSEKVVASREPCTRWLSGEVDPSGGTAEVSPAVDAFALRRRERAGCHAGSDPTKRYLSELLDMLLRPPAWHARAAYLGRGPEMFFPGRGEPTTPAKQLCVACRVRRAASSPGGVRRACGVARASGSGAGAGPRLSAK